MSFDKPQCFQEKVVWTDETECELFGHISSVFKEGKLEAFKEKNIIPSAKHGERVKSEDNMLPSVFLREAYIASVRQLCLSHQLSLLQQNNDLKHTSQRTDERKTLDCFEVAAASPDFNPPEHLWKELGEGTHQT